MIVLTSKKTGAPVHVSLDSIDRLEVGEGGGVTIFAVRKVYDGGPTARIVETPHEIAESREGINRLIKKAGRGIFFDMRGIRCA